MHVLNIRTSQIQRFLLKRTPSKDYFLVRHSGRFLIQGDISSEICKSNIVNELGNPGLVEGTIAVQALGVGLIT